MRLITDPRAALAAASLLALAGCGGSGSKSAEEIAAERCEAVAAARFDNTTTTVTQTAAGSFMPPTGTAIADVPAFCRVQATLKPSTDSNIKVELWLPQEKWNGRFLGLGNGGFGGALDYRALAAGLKRGYAVAHTDMGTAPSTGLDGTPLIGHPEKWLDWGHRSTHLMTTLSKSLLQTYYQQAPKKSYFSGCSSGGGQGLHEAQRYPEDYDGIVVGAPGHNRLGTHQSILWTFAATQRDEASYISPATYKALNASIKSACDGADGLVDGIISRPDLCKPDLSSLTAGQAEAMRKIYADPTHAVTGAQIFPGLLPGYEVIFPNDPPSPTQQVWFNGIFNWVFGESWDWRSFDFGADVDAMQTKLGGIVNATDPDLSAFRARGGKMIAYQGLADDIVAPGEIARYVDAVKDRLGERDSFLRLFNAPGMGHCQSGDAPNIFGNNDLEANTISPDDPERDALAAVQAWVEEGRVPTQLIATQFQGNDSKAAKLRDRPLCVYPQVAQYKGSGDPNAASSFSCVNP